MGKKPNNLLPLPTCRDRDDNMLNKSIPWKKNIGVWKKIIILLIISNRSYVSNNTVEQNSTFILKI
jgi:hypothetical protein